MSTKYSECPHKKNVKVGSTHERIPLRMIFILKFRLFVLSFLVLYDYRGVGGQGKGDP